MPGDGGRGCLAGQLRHGHERAGVTRLVEQASTSTVKHTLRLDTPAGSVPVQITLSPLSGGSYPTCCAVVVDLREREQAERARSDRGSRGRGQCSQRSLPGSARSRAALAAEDGARMGADSRGALRPRRHHAKAVKAIERNARAQAQLISDRLEVARIVAGKLHFELAVVDLEAVVAGVVGSSTLPLDRPVGIAFVADDSDMHVSS
jgi:hypothetical protein